MPLECSLARSARPQEVHHHCSTQQPPPPPHRKCTSTAEWPGQPRLPLGSAPLWQCTLASPDQPQEVHLHHGAHLPALPTPGKWLSFAEWPGSPAHPQEVPHCHRAIMPAPPTLRKSPAAAVNPGKPCPVAGSAPPPQCAHTSSAHPWEASDCHSMPPTVPNYSLASSNSQKKKNTSKMKKLRNHSQLKQQENSLKAVKNETDLCSLTDLVFKREILKVLKKLREDMNSNADSLRKELENIRRSQKKKKL